MFFYANFNGYTPYCLAYSSLAQTCHITILEQLSYELVNQSSLTSLKDAAFGQAIDYAQLRCQSQLLDRQQRQETDERRTIAHNALIDSINILSRNMVGQGEDNSWRAVLGDNRKIIGDFACYIALFLSLEAR